MRDIDVIRMDIDKLNQELVILLEKRFDLASEVVTYKKANELEIFDQEREAEVLENISNLVADKNKSSYVIKTIAGIMDVSKLFQKDNL